jgi:hypothetical protein
MPLAGVSTAMTLAGVNTAMTQLASATAVDENVTLLWNQFLFFKFDLLIVLSETPRPFFAPICFTPLF